MRIRILFIVSLIAFCCADIANAAIPEITGVFAQGGFMVGQVAPQNKVMLDGKPIQLGPEGRFFVGFGRHAPEKSLLKVVEPSGQVYEKQIAITAKTYKTQHIKGIQKKHVNPDPMQVARSRKEAAKIRQARQEFSTLEGVFGAFAPPIKGAITTGVYGSRRTYNGEERNWHKGLDFAAKTGTPVYAPANGVVTAALENTFFNGNLIIVDHGYGLFSIYAHLARMSVKVGDSIHQGQQLGEVGQTGRATGPHLHWGLYWYNTPLDPESFLAHNNVDAIQ